MEHFKSSHGKEKKAVPSTTLTAAWSFRLAQSPFFSADVAALSSRMSQHMVWFRNMKKESETFQCDEMEKKQWL